MTQFVSAKDGVRLAWESAGEGAPVVLIHGFASSREQNWRSTGWIDRLVREGFRVVSFDCRGHGLSDKPHEPEAYGPRMVDDIVSVMEAAKLPKADLIGYSMGAILSVGLLMEHPERVRRAVLAGLGSSYFKPSDPVRHPIAEALLVEDFESIADPVARRFRAFTSQKGKDRVALAACMRSARRKYTPEDLRRVTQPVLVVCGENDDITGPPGPLAEAFANGRALVLAGKDHMSAVGDPAAKRAVVEFLRENGLSSSP